MSLFTKKKKKSSIPLKVYHVTWCPMGLYARHGN